MKLSRAMLSLWTLMRRVAYQAPVYCATCPPETREPMYPLFARTDALVCCNACARLLADSTQRTTSKPKREWPAEPVAVPKVRRIAGRR